jgi:hypothetical protein
VNDELAEMKARLRRAEEFLWRDGGSGILDRVELAQAISRARRLVRHADRGRAPNPELRLTMDQVAMLAGGLR